MNPLIIAAIVAALYFYLKQRKDRSKIVFFKNEANQSLVVNFRDLNGSARTVIEADINTPNTVKNVDSEKQSYQAIFTKLPDNRVKFEAIQNGYSIESIEGDFYTFYTYAEPL